MKVDKKYTKEVDSFLALQTESNTLQSLFSGIDGSTLTKDLVFTLCDRDDVSSKYGNYFMSFNLPTSASRLSTGSTISTQFPELQQLNVDRIVMCPIPRNYYSEFIDGKTITFYVPQNGGTSQSTMSAITLISSTYTSKKILKSENNILLGDNIAFLFSDDINIPYTGKTFDELGRIINNANNTSWNPSTDYDDRPGATSYGEVIGSVASAQAGARGAVKTVGGAIPAPPQNVCYNTDQRTNAHFSVSVDATYPDGRSGYNYDIPVGFVILDKGFAVITHTAITENIPWTSGFTYHDDQPYTSGDKANIYFTGTTDGLQEAGLMTFKDVDTSFKMAAVCIAMPGEFYISNNSTWDYNKVVTAQEENLDFVNYDSVYVTEIGLYNAYDELIAVAKTSEPLEKNYINVITFNIDIQM